MKTTIMVECAKTKSYQKYTVQLSQEVEHETEGGLIAEITKLQSTCRKQVMQQIALDDV